MYGFLIYLMIAAGVSTVIHAVCRRFWLASLLSATVCSVWNLIDETIKAAREHPDTFGLGGDDLVFWGPGLFLMGAIPAFVVALATGVPFLLVRRMNGGDARESDERCGGAVADPSLRRDCDAESSGAGGI